MKVKRLLKRVSAIVCILAVLFVIPVSAASTAPYYKNTFQLLEHNNVRASMMLSKYRLYSSGWFNTGEYTFHDDQPFRMVRYSSGAFTYEDIGTGNPGGEYHVYAYLGVGKNGLGGLKVEAGGILDIKFDWYYNIRLSVATDLNDGNPFIWNLPVTRLDSRTKMYFSDDKTSAWYNIDCVDIENHGLYSGSSSDDSALYWSTVHFQFHNDTDRTLEFEAFLPYYDVLSGFKEPQFKDWVKANGYPKSENLISIAPSTARSYLYMGYKADALPSYKIVAPEQASDFVQTQAIQKASEDISDSIDELGDRLSSDLDDLSTEIGESIEDAVGDEDCQIPDDQYSDKTESVDDANKQYEDANNQEQQLVDEALNNADKALKEYNVFDLTSVTDGISSLARTFAVITPFFNNLVGSLGGEVGALLIYMICGGILISLLGIAGQVFTSSAKTERANARNSARSAERRADTIRRAELRATYGKWWYKHW